MKPPILFRLALSTALAGVVVVALGGHSSSHADFRGRAVAGVAPRTRPPIVMLVLDELPLASLLNEDFHVDAGQFPNFADLEKHSIWFRNATTAAAFTKDAVPSLLSGRLPVDDSFEAWTAPNAFALLDDFYEVRALEGNAVQCTPAPCGSTFDESISALPRRGIMKTFYRGERGSHFARFLSMVRPVTRPVFLYLHLVMPHSPWRYLPGGRQYPGMPRLPGHVFAGGPGRDWLPNHWLVAQAYQRHLLQLAFTDRLLGIILQRLRDARLYHRALVLVTADQGMAFEPGLPKRVATAETVDEIARVPLFVKLPFQREGRIDDRSAQLVDVVPTVADVAGVPVTSAGFDGGSLLGRSPLHHDGRDVDGVPIPRQWSTGRTAIQRKYGLFLRQRETVDLFGLAPRGTRHLIGAHLIDFHITRTRAGAVDVANSAAVVRASPQMDPFPSLLEASLANVPRGETIAVALNDRIACLTRTFMGGGETQFYCMLPPHAFSDPPNALDVFLVEDARKRLLRPSSLRPKMPNPLEASGSFW